MFADTAMLASGRRVEAVMIGVLRKTDGGWR